MAISKAKKESIVAGLVEELRAATAIYVIDYKGLSEADDNMLRKQMHGKSVSYRVVKNTLVKKALEAAGVSGLDNVLAGVTALAFGSADEPMAPAKIFKEFIKGHEDQLVVKAISMDGSVLPGSQLDSVASMPNRQEMLSQIVSIILGPGANLVAIFKGPASKVAGQIKALEEKLQG